MAKKGNSDKQNSKLITNLDNEIGKLKDELSEISKIVDKIQCGDGKSPYWNGTNAYNLVKNMLGQVDNDKVLLDYIMKCKKSIKK